VDINATLLVQMITFALFVWFTMKFVWPPICSALEERAQTITDGLASGERGKREFELAQQRVTESLSEAKVQASDIIDKASKRGGQIIDEAKQQALVEADKVHKQGQERLNQDINQAKEALRMQVASLAVIGAEKILLREVDKSANNDILESLIKEI
tara:strand:- start:1143 stop:1613 length:471 start_codon:yes stop_codon:yes gene_type:complete